MKTKLFTLLFAIVASTSMLFAESGTCGNNLTWNLTDGVLTISGSGNMYDYSYFKYNKALWGTSIVQVIIEDGVTSIGEYAFYGCSSLTSIEIPNSVTSIGNYAFWGCSSMTSVIIGNTVTIIGEGAFSGCSGMTSIDIPNSVTSIGEYTFYGCSSLTSIEIPNSVTSIGEYAFYGCSGLTSIEIPNSVTSIGEYAFYGCSSLTSIEIPNSVTSIGNETFRECTSLTSVTIGNSVTSIGDYAFCECSSLTSIEIPNSITSIGDYAFRECSSLTSIICLGEVPPVLGSNVFDSVYLTSIYVPCGSLDAYQTAEGWSEYASKIKYEPYPSYTITKVAENGYINTTSTDGYTICDKQHPVTCTANPNPGLYFVRWADGNTDNPRTIELTQDTTMEAVFDYVLTDQCGKDNALTWTFDLTTMALEITGKGALTENYTYGTFIESLTIGNEVTSIGQGAFYGCNNLKNVILGSSIKILEESAFANCSSIESFTCFSQRPPTVNQNALNGVDYSTIVYVPADYLDTYKMHDAWGLYDVRPIGATGADVTEVEITPSETTAEVVWPAVENAATYELVIKDKDGNVICTLIFDAQGRLTSIAFGAPSRYDAPQQTQGTGFSFTVTGLEEGTAYNLTITAKDSNGATIDEKSMAFHTDWPEGIEDVQNDDVQSTKVIRDGKVFILRGDKVYTLQGQEVR